MTLLLRYLSCTNIINHTFSTLELASPGFVFLKKGCFVMSRFEVTIKDIDSNMDVIPEAARVSDDDMQKVLFSSIDSIHVSFQENISTIIFDNDAECFPAFGCHPQSPDKIGHSYEIIIKANDKADRLMVAKTIEILFSDNFRRYAKQWGAIDLINDNDKNELHFNIDGMLGVEPVMLIIPTTKPIIRYYDVAEEG